MKILLIYPYWLEKRSDIQDITIPPIGLYYIGAVLKENHYDVEVLNWCTINETPGEIEKRLLEKKPDVIGFSILQANRWGGIEIAGIAKKILPKVKIVFGGVTPTFLWKHFLTHFPQIDVVVTGEGEYTFLQLIKCFENTGAHDLKDIQGIAYRKNNEIIRTAPAEPIADLDALPVPAKYFEYRHLSLTRGCPGKCTFCGSPGFWGPRVRFHSVDYFVEELERLYQKGVRFFYFSDDTFSVDKGRVIAICKMILEKRLDITWVAISRVTTMNEDILYWMRKAGCIQISYGVESGSEKIRHILNKKIATKTIEKAFSMTAQYGILPRAYFIYGCPGESRKTIRETLDLIKRIKPLVIHFFVLSLFPGTRLYEDYRKKMKLTDDIWLNKIEDIKYFEIDPNLSAEDVLSFGKTLRHGYHELIPEIVDTISLVDKKELYPMHADFCARLGMTFDHGDYAHNDAIRGKEKMAEKLYIKALAYHPHPSAYLGLGILSQKENAYGQSIKILSEGLGYFPDNEALNICLGVSHMNIGDFNRAVAVFLRFQHSKQALALLVNCYRALNDGENASFYHKKLESAV